MKSIPGHELTDGAGPGNLSCSRASVWKQLIHSPAWVMESCLGGLGAKALPIRAAARESEVKLRSRFHQSWNQDLGFLS